MLYPLLPMKLKIVRAMMKMHVIMAYGKTGLHVTATANRQEHGIEVLRLNKQYHVTVRIFVFLKSRMILIRRLKMFQLKAKRNFGIIESRMASKLMVDHYHISPDSLSRNLMNFIPILRLVFQIL